MSRSLSSLLRHLRKTVSYSQSIPPNLFRHLSPQYPSPIFATELTFFSNALPFPNCPLRLLQTLSGISPQEALDTAATTDELLAAFDSLESSLSKDDEKLGLGCLKVAQHLNCHHSDDHEKILCFSLRALKILERDGYYPIKIAEALLLVGSISCKLKKFDESLESLNAAGLILSRSENEGRIDSKAAPIHLAVQRQLAETKLVMGRRNEALVNLRMCLELKKSMFDSGDREVGIAYKDLAEAYIGVLDFNEALPLCLKALEIYKNCLGYDTLEVAQMLRLLAVVYTGLGRNEEALEQNELARSALKSLELEDELLLAEIEAANMQTALGKSNDAVNILKGVIQRAEKESESGALVFISMAKVMLNKEEFGDSRRCLEISCGILDKIEVESPVMVAKAFAEVSMLYEAMNEFETAMSLMQRTLAILEKFPQQRHIEGSISARLGWLLLVTGRVAQAVPYLEVAVERLKESFGKKNFGLGFAYKHLGLAYMEMDRLQSAVQMLVHAKGIIHGAFGPHHEDSIDTCQCIANAYGTMGSYALAMDFQQQVVDAWETHGPSASDEIKEAHRLLEQLKKKAQGSVSAVFPANTLPLRLVKDVPAE